MKDYKDGAFRCCAYFCQDHSIITDMSQLAEPICLSAGKILCCGYSLGIPPVDDCGVQCDKPIYDAEQGCCEGKGKLLCCYEEVQCPPGKDIGLAICGKVLMGSINGREMALSTSYAPMQESM
jgi:hypothetical protein